VGWLRRLGVRARLLLVSVVALAVGLAAGGVLLSGVLSFVLLRAVNTEALDTADGVARLVNQNSLSQPIPVSPDMQVQVVDANGRVLAVSASADRLVPILYPEELRNLPDRTGMMIPGDRIHLSGDVRVVVVQAGPPTAPVHVLVARSTADVTQGVHLLRITLLIVFPLLVVLLAAVSWRVLGAALSPVEALRVGAENITGATDRGRPRTGRSEGLLSNTTPGRLPVPGSRDEIHRLAVTLNGMLQRLDTARIRQRAFVADAAHELRSPLTNMRTELEVAQRLSDTTDWLPLAADLLTDVERLSRLVDDLLLLARADDAVAQPARNTVEIELGQLLAEIAARYPAVTYDRPAVPLLVIADRDALGRVVANLLDNAVRHAASRVVLSVTADGAYRKISVVDDGPGIPAADRERVFHRFTRLDDARARDAGGSGLGLAIVRELVRTHHGTVTLTDAGPGLRVEVRLPNG
jgi:signal transduction histidine kinase